MRTVVDIDDLALVAASAELGTMSKVDTVNAALRFVVESRERARRVAKAGEKLYGGSGWDSPEVNRLLKRR